MYVKFCSIFSNFFLNMHLFLSCSHLHIQKVKTKNSSQATFGITGMAAKNSLQVSTVQLLYQAYPLSVLEQQKVSDPD